jgi:hypothetical protein
VDQPVLKEILVDLINTPKSPEEIDKAIDEASNGKP